ncbi:membrane-spanning 4-domains subfamily A member 15-like isoform X1 [Eublepharis macularius]|uniref:Membrane-spanning 4-domains subfamily A member 15-like isoform X1 n=1 Tax=Eublepharis macularius TaxID=481883 RepID=A0AA97KPW2_EUBMA|nr:membrane-spanning 4-domains subfamily A member 15-like isoform X1 [Eublepharis macularius]
MQMAEAPSMNNQTFVIIPPPGMTTILQNQALFPSTINQPPGKVQDTDQPLQTMYQMDQHTGGTGTAGNRYKGHGDAVLGGCPKVVGAIEILIGLVHLTFGSLLVMFSGLYISYIMYLRYLYWGGILFIFSGSLLVFTAHYQTSCVMKCSLALNIISSFASAIGVFFFLADILYFPGDQYEQHAVDWKMAQGLSNTILFFAILEFFIGIIASHSSYNALSHQDEEAICLVTDLKDEVMTQ